MALHIAITYQLWLAIGARLSLRRFWREAKEPVIYAAGANSSLATLPLTLRALDRLGVSRSSSTLGAMVGTNLNNDGIILYEGMAVLLVAQAHGLHLGLGQQLIAAGACLVAAMGVAGIPEAGFISLALVLNTVGLPRRHPAAAAHRRLDPGARALGHQRAQRHGAVDHDRPRPQAGARANNPYVGATGSSRPNISLTGDDTVQYVASRAGAWEMVSRLEGTRCESGAAPQR